MATILKIFRRSTPVQPALGYGDVYKLYHGSAVVSYGDQISTCPIPHRPRSGQPWWMFAGILAEGEYSFECINHTWGKEFGKCLILNNGGPLPSENAKRNDSTVSEVFVHSGGRGSVNPLWRGSLGCITVHPDKWQAFIDQFTLGEKGTVVITRKIELEEWAWN